MGFEGAPTSTKITEECYVNPTCHVSNKCSIITALIDSLAAAGIICSCIVLLKFMSASSQRNAKETTFSKHFNVFEINPDQREFLHFIGREKLYAVLSNPWAIVIGLCTGTKKFTFEPKNCTVAAQIVSLEVNKWSSSCLGDTMGWKFSGVTRKIKNHDKFH